MMQLHIEDIPKMNYTHEIYSLCKNIDKYLDISVNISNKKVITKLRKITSIRSINSSLAIEANSLSLNEVRNVINGKLIEGPFDEIVEVKNAANAYDMIENIELFTINGFLSVEEVLMFGLVPENGFRMGNVGVFNGDVCEYTAPSAEDVRLMMEKLLSWAGKSDYPGYLLGAVVHFYIECIHPLNDGNGRIGRLWHNEIMRRSNKSFNYISIENAIHDNQEEYYSTLRRCQTDFDCTEFVAFCLRLLISELERISILNDESVIKVLSVMNGKYMTASEIMDRLDLSNRSFFLKNYLRPAVEHGFVEMYDPEHPRSRNQKYRSTLG